MEASALISILRSVPSVPTLAMRRAVLTQKLFMLVPPDAAAVLHALATRAVGGDWRARAVAVALASVLAHRRQRTDVAGFHLIRDAASTAGLELIACLCGDDPAPKSLARRGRLPEVGLNTEVFFPSVPQVRYPSDEGPHKLHVVYPSSGLFSVGNGFLGYSPMPTKVLCAHPDPRFLARVLRTRWLRLQDVLAAASRRPSTPAVTITIATDDRWFVNTRVRCALAENPFTPSWLSTALRLALPLARPGNRVGDHPVDERAP